MHKRAKITASMRAIIMGGMTKAKITPTTNPRMNSPQSRFIIFLKNNTHTPFLAII